MNNFNFCGENICCFFGALFTFVLNARLLPFPFGPPLRAKSRCQIPRFSMFGIMRAVIGHVGNILKTCENRQDSFLVVDTGFSLWPGSKFRESLFEIWVGPSFDRNSSKFGRPGAQERKVFRVAWRIHGSRCCTPRRASFSAGMTLTIGCKECPGA